MVSRIEDQPLKRVWIRFLSAISAYLCALCVNFFTTTINAEITEKTSKSGQGLLPLLFRCLETGAVDHFTQFGFG